MPLPVVAIVAEGASLPAEARPAIVKSCANALGESQCVEQGDPLAPAARYLALVAVVGDGKLRVNLRSRFDNLPRGERDLLFSSAALGSEHWSSTGLVVAALVADAEQAPAAHAPPSLPRKPEVSRAAQDVWVRASVTGVASPGFDFDPWRLGGTLRLAFGFGGAVLYPVFTTRWLTASGLVRSDVVSGGIGLGFRLINLADRVELDLELVGLADALLVSAATRDGAEQSFRVRYGARLGVSSSLRLTGPLYGFGGVDATWLGKRVTLEIDGIRRGAEPRYLPGFEVGLGLTF